MRLKVNFFQEIERTIIKLQVLFFIRSQFYIIFDNFDQQAETLIMSLKVTKSIIGNFGSQDRSWVYKNVHEIKSI